MVRLKGLHRVRVGGRTYYYAWRGGPRIEEEFDTPEFIAAFNELRLPLSGADRRIFATWVALYKASPEFKELSERTKQVWLPWMDRILDEFGKLHIRNFDRPKIRVDIKHWRDRWRATPRTADFAKQVLSRVLSFAVSEGVLAANPCNGIKNLYKMNRASIIWERDDVERLCAVASAEVGLALRLACMTGLRQGDLLKLCWGHIGTHEIIIKTGKSKGHRLARVPITRDIRAVLSTIPKRSTRVLTTSKGKPWGPGFGSSWNKAMDDAGLKAKGLHFHDARGTAATNFYCAGLEVREIAEIMAWDEDHVRDMIDRYVRRDDIVKARIRKLESFTPNG